MRLRLFIVSITVALTTVASAALADGPTVAPTFGSAGQLAISSDANLQVSHTSESGNGYSANSLTLLPAVDYFPINGLSVGGYVLFAVNGATNTDSSSTSFGIGPRIGYNFTLTDTLSFWPKVSIGIEHTSVGGDGDLLITASIFAPFLVHPAPHFFLGLGPFFSTDLSNSLSGPMTTIDGAKITTYGLAFTVGGWL